MGKFMFWLSKLFFEKLLKRPPAREVAEKIVKEVDEHNRDNRGSKCRKCGSEKMINDVTGSEGIFTEPHRFYRCRDCGNAQDNDGSSMKWKSDELQKQRIKETNSGGYRYRFFTENQLIILAIATVVAGIIGICKLISLAAGLIARV